MCGKLCKKLKQKYPAICFSADRQQIIYIISEQSAII